MRHLKPYNESTHSQKDIEEICYDLTDDKGFVVNITDNINGTYISWTVIIKKRGIGFTKFIIDDEIKDVLLRIIDHLGDKFDRLSIKTNEGRHGWQTFYRKSRNKDFKYTADWRTEITIPQDIPVDCINIVLVEGEEL